MKENKGLIIAIVLIVVAAGVAMLIARSKNQKYSNKGYQDATDGKGGFWGSLFGNAANGAESLGRNQASTITSLGNAISSIIATSKSDGDAKFAYYDYADPYNATPYNQKYNYGPYIAVGVVALAIAAMAIFSKK